MTTSVPERQGGFTLIEVLVAFTVAALTLGALSQAFSTGIGAAARATAEKEALLIAQSSLEGLVGEAVRPTDKTDHVADKYSRRLVLRPSSERLTALPGGSQPVLYEVEITISWGETLQTRSVSLHTLRLGY
jgi:general secretion pathway protein I